MNPEKRNKKYLMIGKEKIREKEKRERRYRKNIDLK